MATTFSSLKTSVTNYLGRADSDIATRVGEFINLRQRLICRQLNFPFMQDQANGTMTASTATYTISAYLPSSTATFSTFKEELRVDLRNTGNTERQGLVKLDIMDVERDERFDDLSKEGQPDTYWVWQDKFVFYPTPDAAYRFVVKGYCYLADLSATTDHNAITDEYPEVLIYGATAEGCLYYEDDAGAAQYEGLYQKALGDMVRRFTAKKYANTFWQIKPRLGEAIGAEKNPYRDITTEYT